MPDKTKQAPKKKKDDNSVSSTVSRVGHPEDVFEWRVQEFEAMGFDRKKSEFLADTRIDLHSAAALKNAGCPLNLLEEILLGTGPHGEDELWYHPMGEHE